MNVATPQLRIAQRIEHYWEIPIEESAALLAKYALAVLADSMEKDRG